MKPLTPRQARFVAEYSAVPIAAVAALRAGYSPRSARNGGAVLLRNPAVAAALAEADGRAIAGIELRAERVIAQAMRVALADIAGIVEADGTPRPLAAIGAEARAGFAAVESIELPGKRGARLIAIERLDKLAALAFLARHAGLLDTDAAPPVEDGDGDSDGAAGGNALTPRQARFVADYATDFNATRAALAAGYAPSQAQQHGSRLLKRPAVRRAIERTSAALAGRAGLDPARVLREIGCIAFADIGRLYDSAGRLKPLGEIDRDTRAALRSLHIRHRAGGRRIRARLFDKTRALGLLHRHFGRQEEGGGGDERGAALDAAIDAALARAP